MGLRHPVLYDVRTNHDLQYSVKIHDVVYRA